MAGQPRKKSKLRIGKHKLEYGKSYLGDPSCLQLKFTREAVKNLQSLPNRKAPALSVQFSSQNGGLITIGDEFTTSFKLTQRSNGGAGSVQDGPVVECLRTTQSAFSVDGIVGGKIQLVPQDASAIADARKQIEHDASTRNASSTQLHDVQDASNGVRSDPPLSYGTQKSKRRQFSVLHDIQSQAQLDASVKSYQTEHKEYVRGTGELLRVKKTFEDLGNELDSAPGSEKSRLESQIKGLYRRISEPYEVQYSYCTRQHEFLTSLRRAIEAYQSAM
eukprot:m.921097 g.921097  ORF g.921097 m.921097 type:complete len:276 (+) comp23756_c0_seq4:416-1243(+)